MENERAVTTEVEAATDESQPASASVHDDSAAAVDGDTLTADEQAASEAVRSVRFSMPNIEEEKVEITEDLEEQTGAAGSENRCSKERTSTDGNIGATYVDERAPNINL